MNRKVKGIIYIVISSFFFASMGMLVHQTGDLPFLQKSFFRNAVALIVAFIMLKKQHVSFRIEPGTRRYAFLRATFGTVSMVCNYYAIDRLPLSDASMLSKMSPFFAIVFSGIFLKEPVHKKQWFYICVAFIGSLFVLKPEMHTLVSFAAVVALIGGISSGFAQTMVRVLNCRHVPQWLIIFCFSLMSCAVTLPFFIVFFVPMTLQQVLLLLAAGGTATIAQFCLTRAYYYAAASEISIYDYSQICFSAILGYVFFHQLADRWSYLGYLIIAAAAIGMYFFNQKNSTVQAIEPDRR
ncbi:MAG: DMT family transporter [Firmicutes bacterium]|nr:DMT family transporter [Bacillota bacterium]